MADKTSLLQTAVLIGIGLLVVSILFPGVLPFGQGAAANAGGTGTGGTPNGNTINVNANTCADSSTIVIGNAKDKYTPTTSYSGEAHRLILNGNDLGNFVDGTSRSFVKGDKVTVYTAFNATGEYSRMMSFEVGCGGAYTMSALPESVVVGGDGLDAFNLVQNVTVAANVPITLFDENGNPMSSTANAQAIGASQRKNLKFKVEGPSRAGFSPDRKALMICDVNKSLFADLNPGPSGKTVETTAVPQQHTRLAGIGLSAATDYVSYGFEFSGVKNNDVFEDTIEFVADNTNNPDTLGNVTCTFYDQDYYKHSVNGQIVLGYETDLRADIGGPNPTATWRFS